MIASFIQSISFRSLKKDVVISALQVFAASMFLALCAQIHVPLYFTPVFMSGQTFGVMLIGATLGSRKGFLSVLAYLIEGSLGLPVFAGGGFGLMSLAGLNGGYFLGFLAQAYFVGWYVERHASISTLKVLPALLFSCVLQMSLGVMWLSLFMPFASALTIGFFPFLLGEVIKSVAVASYLKVACRKF